MQNEYNQNKILADVRGHVIQIAIELEMKINLFLSRHFGRNSKIKDDLFYHLFITNKISFDSKIELLDITIKQYYTGFKKRNPDYCNDLKNIIKARNNFAHAHLDITQKGKDNIKIGTLSLTKYSKAVLTHNEDYTQAKVEELTNLMYKYIEEMNRLISEKN